MKATGIVRRIDDLGRIVIPKEIRKTLKIQEGNPLEIFTDGEGSVIFRKYSPIGEMFSLAEMYAQTVHTVLGRGCVICDTDRVIAAAGMPKKELLEKPVTERLRGLITQKRSSPPGEQLVISENCPRLGENMIPVVASGDPMGAVLLLESNGKPGNAAEEALAVGLVKTLATLLGKQAE